MKQKEEIKSYRERQLECPKCKEKVKPYVWTTGPYSPCGFHWEESCPVCGYIFSED